MGIDENTPLELRLDHGNLIVSPANIGIGEQNLQEGIDHVRDQYGYVLKRLA
jgi:hypothetical protein